MFLHTMRHLFVHGVLHIYLQITANKALLQMLPSCPYIGRVEAYIVQLDVVIISPFGKYEMYFH